MVVSYEENAALLRVSVTEFLNYHLTANKIFTLLQVNNVDLFALNHSVYKNK